MAVRQYLTQVGRALVERPFHDLRKVTRTFTVNGGGLPAATVNAEVLFAYGTADDEFANALLVDRQMQQTNNEKSGYVTGLVEVYQEFTNLTKVNVGEDQILRFDDGRTAQVRRFVCLASQAEALAASVGDTYGGRACQDVKILKHGVGAEITETYISAGKLSESNTLKNNDKLHLTTLVYFNEVPPTPSGFYLFDKQEKSTEGLTTYSYTFAKGDGEISRKTSYRSSADAGTNGITIVAITHLTSLSTVVNPTSAPAGTNLIDLDRSEEDGYCVWRVVYAKGVGQSRTRTQSRSDGSVVYTVSELGVSADTPAYPGTGTGVLMELDNDQGEGFFVNTATYVKLPADDTIPVRHNWPQPGFAFFSGTQLVLRPPTVRSLWANMTVTYGTSKLTPTVWSVEQYGSFKEVFTPTDTGIAQNSSRALGQYLCAGNTVFDSDAEYNGIQCDTFSATTFESTPDSLPTGTTVIHADNEEYLTALDGTKYYRRISISADL